MPEPRAARDLAAEHALERRRELIDERLDRLAHAAGVHDVRVPDQPEPDPGDEDREHDAQALPGELAREQRRRSRGRADDAEAQGRPQIAHAAAVQDDRRDDGGREHDEQRRRFGGVLRNVHDERENGTIRMPPPTPSKPGSRAREQPEQHKCDEQRDAAHARTPMNTPTPTRKTPKRELQDVLVERISRPAPIRAPATAPIASATA